MQGAHHTIDTVLHFLVYEPDHHPKRLHKLVVASFVGGPDAVTALGAGIAEGRVMSCNREDYVRGPESFRRLERRIGLNDISHVILYSSIAAISGIVESPEPSDDTESYIIDMQKPPSFIRRRLQKRYYTSPLCQDRTSWLIEANSFSVIGGTIRYITVSGFARNCRISARPIRKVSANTASSFFSVYNSMPVLPCQSKARRTNTI